MGVETVQGYNLHGPPGCNPKTRDHKQAAIFVEFADTFSCHTAQADTKFSTIVPRYVLNLVCRSRSLSFEH
jgi:hypothetical protein